MLLRRQLEELEAGQFSPTFTRMAKRTTSVTPRESPRQEQVSVV
jgi:hypothetical protein